MVEVGLVIFGVAALVGGGAAVVRRFRRLSNSWKATVPLDTECSICLEPVHGSAPVTLLGCGHLYHRRCLVAWMAVNSDMPCPQCGLNKRQHEDHVRERRWATGLSFARDPASAGLRG